jgi:hypothetical protein
VAGPSRQEHTVRAPGCRGGREALITALSAVFVTKRCEGGLLAALSSRSRDPGVNEIFTGRPREFHLVRTAVHWTVAQ